MPVPIEEASRFGIVITDDSGKITEFQEKPPQPKSNLASMGIYIFSWKALKEALVALKDEPGCDFGKHIIPYCHEKGERCLLMNTMGTGKMLEHWILLAG